MEEQIELKRIDFSQKTFTANGNEYYIANTLCFDRFQKMTEIEFDLRYGVNHAKMLEDMSVLYEDLNAQRFADCAVRIYNWMQAIADLQDRKQPILEYCALFLNKKGEDVKTWSQEMVDDKINDWTTEGIDAVSFFPLALNIGNGLKNAYINAIPTT